MEGESMRAAEDTKHQKLLAEAATVNADDLEAAAEMWDTMTQEKHCPGRQAARDALRDMSHAKE